MKKDYFLKFVFATAFAFTVISCSETADDQQYRESQLALKDQVSSETVARAGNDRIIFTQVVRLDGSQEVSVPGVITETTGIAILRVSESKKLYSKVIIQNLADGDALRFSHIHVGAAGFNGPVSIGIADNAADFGVNKEFQLTDAQFTLITTGAAYVNVHSNFFPSGIVRGQIR